MWNFDLFSFILGCWIGSTIFIIVILLLGKLFGDDETKK